jgi:hypothetical protein
MLLQDMTSEMTFGDYSLWFMFMIALVFGLGYHFHKYLMVKEAYAKNYASIKNQYLREVKKKMNGKR